MKYVVLKVTDHRSTCDEQDTVREVPFVFPEELVHSMVAEAMTKMLTRESWEAKRYRTVEPLSAGFLHSMTFAAGAKTGFFCHGRSESMKLSSRPELDSRLLVNYDYSHGIA